MLKSLKFLLPFLAAWAMSSAADFKIPFEQYKLKNGMRVILSQDNSTPVVAVYMIFGVGARSEEKGRTGFAHLFEHMMFQGSKNAPKGTHSKIIESNGGWDNGSTHPDYTDYFEMLPSNKLAAALWLESDRMRGLNLTDENLANQKEAVKQERRLRADNQPYVTAIVDTWPELAFRNWGSSHSLIGSFEDLNAATTADVAKFFRTFYAPNNAVLSITGDIRVPDAKRLIETYFGDIEPQPQPRHPDLTEPPATQPKQGKVQDAQAKVPAVLIGYPGPVRRSPDYYALVMLDVLLTGGDSSRFQQDLVKGKQSVVQFQADLGWPFASPSDYRNPGLYALFLLHNPAFQGGQIVEQVQQEIEKIQKDGVEVKDLERAKTVFRSVRLNQLQTTLTRAQLLAQYELFDADPNLINTEMAEFLAVTPERVKAVAGQYLKPGVRTVLEIVPAPAKQEEKK